MVADDNTWRVAGAQVHEHLEKAGRDLHEPYRFPENTFVYADYANIETLRTRSASTRPSRSRSARAA